MLTILIIISFFAVLRDNDYIEQFHIDDNKFQGKIPLAVASMDALGTFHYHHCSSKSYTTLFMSYYISNTCIELTRSRFQNLLFIVWQWNLNFNIMDLLEKYLSKYALWV